MVESRLVTLVGPGGVGKTRLAVELADRSKKAFRDGVWLIELDSLRTGDRVTSAVATTLSVPDQSNRAALDRVVDYLRDKEVLLLLDNCEHVLQETAELTNALLTAVPKVRILATSREPLHLVSEYVYEVPPLSTPRADEDDGGETIEHFESVTLLVDRARQLVPDFAISPENQAVIAQICARLDGIPLAIELAATRLRSLSPAQLLERLDQRFSLLTRGDRTTLPRQQTLQALIDWSYDLCSPHEQLLWRRLAIFPDVFDLSAAEHVCGFGELETCEVFDLLDQLVAKSIVQTDRAGGQVRYRLLMTVREYGTQLLTDAAEEYELRRRHRDHYLAKAVDRVEAWFGPKQAEAVIVSWRERPNLIAAMQWSLATEGEHDVAAKIAVALRYHWIAGGFLSDGRAWLDRILACSTLSLHARGSAAWVAGWVCLIQGDRDEAARYLDISLAAAASLQDPELVTHAEHWQALYLLFGGELDRAITLYRKVIQDHERHGKTADQLTATYQLIMAQAFNGQAKEGLVTSATALQVTDEHGERWNRSYLWWISGVCHRQLGDFNAARTAATQALHIQQDFHDAICTALSIELLSWVAVDTADFERGKELADAADAVWLELGTGINAFGPHIAKIADTSAAKFKRALGGNAPADSAVIPRISKAEALAIGLGTKQKQKKVVRAENNPLTKREMEIAELVARGLTNRQVATKLVVSHRTVDGHIERIFTKLDFTSRAQLASWVESLQRAA